MTTKTRERADRCRVCYVRERLLNPVGARTEQGTAKPSRRPSETRQKPNTPKHPRRGFDASCFCASRHAHDFIPSPPPSKSSSCLSKILCKSREPWVYLQAHRVHRPVPATPLVRPPTTVLPPTQQTPSFVLGAANRSYKHQYANIYFARLQLLRKYVLARARRRWKDVSGACCDCG